MGGLGWSRCCVWLRWVWGGVGVMYRCSVVVFGWVGWSGIADRVGVKWGAGVFGF